MDVDVEAVSVRTHDCSIEVESAAQINTAYINKNLWPGLVGDIEFDPLIDRLGFHIQDTGLEDWIWL